MKLRARLCARRESRVSPNGIPVENDARAGAVTTGSL